MSSRPHSYLANDMAQTSVQLLNNFKDDLLHSRYFLIYFIGWIVIVIMALVSLGVFSRQTAQSDDHKYQEMWTTTVDQLSFPKFHFLVTPDSIFYDNPTLPTISSISCYHNNKTVKAGGNCNGEKNNQTCVLVNGNEVTGTQNNKNPQSQRIDCTINLDISALDLNDTQIQNIFLSWEVDNTGVANFGSNSYASMLCAPNARTWVLVTPVSYDGELAWDRQQQFHGATEPDLTNVKFYVTTIINSFTYWNWKARSSAQHDGWNTAAYCGGFAFFAYLIHVIFMFIVGFAFPNDSLILGGKKHDSGLNENDGLLKHQHNDL